MSVAPTIQGREFKYLNFSSKEGLAGDNIYSITQDKDGFIWIATGTGLSRFDGTAFKNFTTEDGLPSNDIILVKRDSKNRIWIFPFKDEVCYYYKGRIYNKHNDSTLKKMPPLSETKQMAEDAAGRIMIITPNLYVVINTDNTLSTFTRPNTGSFTFNPVSANIFIEQEIWDTAAWSDYRYKSYNCSDYGGTGISKYALQSPSHLIAYDKYHKVIFSKRDFPTARNSYGLIFDSLLAANTADGCHLYNIYNNQYDHLLKGYPVAYTFIDNESGIWLGTRGMGVFYLSPYRNFSLSGTAEDKPLQAYNFYVTREHLIVGNSHSQFRYLDKDNYSLGKLINNDAITAEMLYPTRGNLLKCSEVGIGSILKKHQISEHAIKTIAIDHDTLIVATVSDLQKVVLRNKKTTVVWDGRTTAAYSANGVNYVGTLDGLYIFKSDLKIYSAKNSTPVLKGTVVSIAHSFNNNLVWIITSDKGVFCLKNNKVVRHINSANGLSSNICTSIFTDGDKVIVGTNNGLNIIDPGNNGKVTCFYTIDGLSTDNINCVSLSGSKAWVGTPKGISIIDISRMLHPPSYRLVITEILVSGKLIDPNLQAIQLPPAHNNIEIRFSAVSFRSMGKFRYYYRLTDLDKDWQNTTNNSLKYQSLPPGQYKLEIFAIDRFGTKSNVITLGINVGRLWWQYWWVQVSGLILVFAFILWVLQRRVKNQRLKAAEKIALKEKIAHLEQVALQAQMNPHFIFNSLNSFYQYVINRDIKGASKFMNDFSKLLRLLFELMSYKELSLDKEITFLTTYLELEKVKLNDAFIYRIEIDDHVPIEEIYIPTFIVQPFVENCIRHGIQNRMDKLGVLNISVFLSSQSVIIKIADNGVGRQYAAMIKEKGVTIHDSKGISLTAERITLFNKSHNTNITVETSDQYTDTGKPAGTLVTISIPIK